MRHQGWHGDPSPCAAPKPQVPDTSTCPLALTQLPSPAMHSTAPVQAPPLLLSPPPSPRAQPLRPRDPRPQILNHTLR